MNSLPFVLAAAASVTTVGLIYKMRSVASHTAAKRAAYINNYAFATSLRGKLAFKYPHLDSDQLDQVFQGLRQFFLVCLAAKVVNGGVTVGMPSKVVDELWHHFILMSREYSAFCEQAFGKYLHHTPDSEMKGGLNLPLSNTLHQLHTPSANMAGATMIAGVPLLFALDRSLAIEGGHQYDADAVAKLAQKRKDRMASNRSSGDAGSFDASLGSHSDSSHSNHCAPALDSSGCADAGGSSSASCGAGASGCGGGCSS